MELTNKHTTIDGLPSAGLWNWGRDYMESKKGRMTKGWQGHRINKDNLFALFLLWEARAEWN